MVNIYAKLQITAKMPSKLKKNDICHCKSEKIPYFCCPKKINNLLIIEIIMTKADIVNEVAKATGIEKIAVQNVIESFMESVKDSLAKDNNVYLRGFGSFIVKKRAKKTARNISKNTTLIIPEHNIPSFKPAKVFMNKVKGSSK